jgi:hypothetical protein
MWRISFFRVAQNASIAALFGSGGSCTLSGMGISVSCQVTYTPSSLGSGTHRLTASYQGDGSHATSTGSTNVSVINPPEITSISPADGATGVARTTPAVAVFSTAMDKPSAQAAFSLTRTSDGAAVNGSFSWYGNALIFLPASPLANGTNYTATVSTAAKDLFGNTMGAAKTWRFTTATQPLITSVTPGNEQDLRPERVLAQAHQQRRGRERHVLLGRQRTDFQALERPGVQHPVHGQRDRRGQRLRRQRAAQPTELAVHHRQLMSPPDRGDEAPQAPSRRVRECCRDD